MNFPQGALAAVLQARDNPEAFDTHANNVELNRMKGKLAKFLEYQHTTNPNLNWHTQSAWVEYFPNDGLGGLIGTFCYWVVVERENTVSLLTLYQKDIRTLYKVVLEKFPNWSTIKDPSAGLEALKKTSATLAAVNKALQKIFISRSADIQRAEPMYIPDVCRLVQACPPTPTGYRNATLLYLLAETGARAIAFTQVVVEKPEYVEDLKRWRIYYPSQKRKGVTMTTRSHLLSPEGSDYFGKFYWVRDNVEWKNPETLLCVATTEEIDNILEDICLYAGYPARFFSAHSGRAGKITGDIANSILEGGNMGQGQLLASATGDFGKTSDAMRSYIKHMADEVQEFVGKVQSINELTVYQLHSCLRQNKVVLQGPFQYTRLNNNEGFHPDYIKVVEELHDHYAVKLGRPTSDTDTFGKCNRIESLLRKLGTMMNLDCKMSHVTVLQALDLIWGADISRKRTNLLRILTRINQYDIVIDEFVRMVVVPDEVLQYLRLAKIPKNYKQHPKVATKYNVTSSTNMATFVTAKEKRVAKRAIPFVVVGQNQYDIDDLTKAQKTYVIECNKNKQKINANMFHNLVDMDYSDDEDDNDNDE